MPHLIGLEVDYTGFFLQAWAVLATLGEANLSTTVVGLGALALLFLIKRFWPLAPSALIAVILSVLAVYLLGLAAHGVKVIGEVDYFSAPMLIHEQAIYLHQSRPFVVEKLDWEGRTAYAREVDVDYYTDSVAETDIRVLTVEQEQEIPSSKSLPQVSASRHFGEVAVSTLVPKYKKIKFETHENVGFGDIHLPQQDMQTEAYWVDFSDGLMQTLAQEGIDLGGGLRALATALVNVVPIYVLCDPKDIRSSPMVRAPFSGLPTIYLWDAYPGGIGIAQKIYELDERLFKSVDEAIKNCICRTGCPSCVGPPLEVGDRGKEAAEKLLAYLLR